MAITIKHGHMPHMAMEACNDAIARILAAPDHWVRPQLQPRSESQRPEALLALVVAVVVVRCLFCFCLNFCFIGAYDAGTEARQSSNTRM